jgi:protein subunit release factor A
VIIGGLLPLLDFRVRTYNPELKKVQDFRVGITNPEINKLYLQTLR